MGRKKMTTERAIRWAVPDPKDASVVYVMEYWETTSIGDVPTSRNVKSTVLYAWDDTQAQGLANEFLRKKQLELHARKDSRRTNVIVSLKRLILHRTVQKDAVKTYRIYFKRFQRSAQKLVQVNWNQDVYADSDEGAYRHADSIATLRRAERKVVSVEVLRIVEVVSLPVYRALARDPILIR